ncbi:MAG: ribosomal L7Ae/L30e/S12e/Gadd45 family protein [Ruminococcus sp.]|nr:ribosomal L7Ae/L30e/S12e/Gadd45 family protein [Candidatus Apopatosoma intestinale]
MSEEKKENMRKLLGACGLAKRAGKAAIGTELACDAVRAGTARLGIASETASPNTKKRLVNCFSYYGIPLVFLETDTAALGASVGKSETACIAITDQNFAELAFRYLNERKDG